MKVALSHGPKMSIVDLASGCETVLPSLDALRGDDRLCYFWAGHAAGEWLIGGGLWTRGGFSTNTWSLEGPTGSWAEGPVTPTASSGGAAVSVGDAVYVIGGYAARGQLNPDLLRYKGGSWTRMAPPPAGKHLFATVLNGRIHVFSTANVLIEHEDEDDEDGREARHNVYDILQNTWSSKILPENDSISYTRTFINTGPPVQLSPHASKMVASSS